MSDKKITEYNVTDHGVDNSQYFQGHGISYTDYEDTATGCGDSYNEAFEDALDSLAQSGWDVSTIENEEKDNPKASMGVEEWLREDGTLEEDEEPNEDCYYYVSIDVK